MERPGSFFRGSELPRLLVLAVVAIVGWALLWHFAQQQPPADETPVTATEKPEPVVADKSVEFETVTDRTPMSFRDNAAYALLLDRVRGKTHADLAAVSRRDVVLAHLWQTPELYRGIPIHLAGSTQRVIRSPSKLTKSGWIYEAYVTTPEAPKVSYVCVFEEPPPGLPIGSHVTERVVFNGYFLKLWKYQAGDVPRGAPVLVGRIGWTPSPVQLPGTGGSTTLRWTLVLAILFAIAAVRLGLPRRPLFSNPLRTRIRSTLTRDQEIDPGALDDWAHSMRDAGDAAPDAHPEEADRGKRSGLL